MTRFWTSDTHFSHGNIIKYCKRPFKDYGEMDNILINNWNSVVMPDDEVWFLGDFGMRKRTLLINHFNRLNGIKNLVLGNHDDPDVMRTWAWNSVEHYAEVQEDGVTVCMSHYPMKTWNRVGHGSIMLHGHCHGAVRGNSQTLDVGVDAWNFTPVSMEKIKKRLASLPPFEPIDHHLGYSPDK